MESPQGHHHHHKEGSDHYHTKDCDKDGKPRASPPITREDQIITIPRIVTKDGKLRASPSPPLTTQQANHNDNKSGPKTPGPQTNRDAGGSGKHLEKMRRL
jgi:hypothetical protein